MTADRPLLLVERALGLGDLLTAVPALHALARVFPEHRRVLLTTAPLAPLATLTGTVDDTVAVAPLAAPPASVAGADIAVNLHGRGPESHRALLSAGPRRLVAFGNSDAGVAGPAWRAQEHEVLRWCRLLEESGIPTDPRQLDIAAPELHVPAHLHGATVLHVGAGSPARRWPVERWAAVARAEMAAGRQVVLTAGPGEEPLAQQAARLVGPGRLCDVVVVRREVLALAAVVAAAARVVSTDTGVAHLATALRRPSVVLFGPVSPELWGPPSDRPWHVALWHGRTGAPYADSPDLGLLQIDVEEVLDALDRLPAATEPFTSSRT